MYEVGLHGLHSIVITLYETATTGLDHRVCKPTDIYTPLFVTRDRQIQTKSKSNRA